MRVQYAKTSFPIRAQLRDTMQRANELPDDHSEREPPDPFPNSVVKPLSADGSVGSPHVRVGHCQASNPIPPRARLAGVFFWAEERSEKGAPGEREPGERGIALRHDLAQT